MKGLARILDVSCIGDLAGKEIAGLGVHQVPDPLVILLLALFFDEHRRFIAVPDVPNIGLVLLGVSREEFRYFLNPVQDRWLGD